MPFLASNFSPRVTGATRTRLFQPDGKTVFEPEAVRQSILDITRPEH